MEFSSCPRLHLVLSFSSLSRKKVPFAIWKFFERVLNEIATDYLLLLIKSASPLDIIPKITLAGSAAVLFHDSKVPRIHQQLFRIPIRVLVL